MNTEIGGMNSLPQTTDQIIDTDKELQTPKKGEASDDSIEDSTQSPATQCQSSPEAPSTPPNQTSQP